jgi:hypothetical protein
MAVSTPSRGKALLFDYLPHINIHQYLRDDEPIEEKGVLFVIYQTGESYVIPITRRTNGSMFDMHGRLLSQEVSGRRVAKGVYPHA